MTNKIDGPEKLRYDLSSENGLACQQLYLIGCLEYIRKGYTLVVPHSDGIVLGPLCVAEH